MSATLIDVREFPEFAAGHIAQSRLVPLGTLDRACEAWDRSQPLMLVCKSGRRAEAARLLLEARSFTHLSVLAGGIDAWLAAGKPLVVEPRKPWSMERQVRVAAGTLVLLSLLFAWLVSPLFLAATAFVAAGLVFAGISDICMMASLLGRLPWNRPPRIDPPASLQ